MHEVCRSILDRFPDEKFKEHLFAKVKKLAQAAFKVKDFGVKLNELMFCYGLHDNTKSAYKEKPLDDNILQKTMMEALEDYNNRSTGKA